jgi:hypothetical protein
MVILMIYQTNLVKLVKTKDNQPCTLYNRKKFFKKFNVNVDISRTKSRVKHHK